MVLRVRLLPIPLLLKGKIQVLMPVVYSVTETSFSDHVVKDVCRSCGDVASVNRRDYDFPILRNHQIPRFAFAVLSDYSKCVYCYL